MSNEISVTTSTNSISATSTGGVKVFTGLTDTPSTYTGQGSKAVKVNSGATALEFVAPEFVDIGALTESANIAINCQSIRNAVATITGMTRTATTLTLSNLSLILNLSMTKNNSDQDLTFTLAGTGLVFDVFDSTNNVYSRATTVTISGTDSNNSWELSFKNTGITGTVVQVTGTIDSFS